MNSLTNKIVDEIEGSFRTWVELPRGNISRHKHIPVSAVDRNSWRGQARAQLWSITKRKILFANELRSKVSGGRRDVNESRTCS